MSIKLKDLYYVICSLLCLFMWILMLMNVKDGRYNIEKKVSIVLVSNLCSTNNDVVAQTGNLITYPETPNRFVESTDFGLCCYYAKINTNMSVCCNHIFICL